MRIVRLLISLISSAGLCSRSLPWSVPGSEKNGTSKLMPQDGHSEAEPAMSAGASISWRQFLQKNESMRFFGKEAAALGVVSKPSAAKSIRIV